jgi:hypothetical protein
MGDDGSVLVESIDMFDLAELVDVFDSVVSISLVFEISIFTTLISKEKRIID